MEKPEGNKKEEWPAAERVTLPAEEPPVPQQRVVVTPQADTLQEKSTTEGGKPSFFKKYGLVLIIIDIILVLGLVVMGVAYWKMSQEKALPSPTPTPVSLPTPSEETDAQTSALEEQGTSDEIEDIEADLNATDLSEIDKELDDIESELAAP